jgi:hypothetical protein
MRFARALFTLVLLAAALSTAPVTAQSWQGPWDWHAQVNPAMCPGSSEFSHAAVIPTGLHAGKVLMWRVEFDPNSMPPCQLTGNTESWLFDPNSPTQLVRIVDTSPLGSSIFCANASWQPNGELLVLGGASPGSFAEWTYRFRPQHLGAPVDTTTGPTIYTLSSTPAWFRISNSKTPHYYVTVITLNAQDALYGAVPPVCGTIRGGSQLSLGGPVDYNEDGNEFWEPIYQSSQFWGCPLVPVGMAPPNPHAGYLAPIAPNYDRYSLHPASNPADPRMDSYPRATQLSTGEILVGGDVDTVAPCDDQWTLFGPPPIPLGAWWVIKPRYDPAQPDWQLHKGLIVPSIDQFYDSMVLIHLLGSPDRVIRVGGSTPNAAHTAGSWVANDSIQEFVKASTSEPVVDGQWVSVVSDPAKLKRVFQNLVALPTGELFIVGGNMVDSYNGHGSICGQATGAQPALQPVIYTPHPSNPAFAGTLSGLLPAGNPDPATNPPLSVPRLYHSLAVLLPDGSVFVAGGIPPQSHPWPNNYRFPEFSGEIFRPAYLSLPFRPSIQTPLGEVVFGSSFQIDVLRQATNMIDRVVLMRPAALTHHFCNDQRYVELDFQHGPTDPSGGLVQETLTVTAPTHSLIQPGYSMLFVVERNPSGDRSPSIGKFVKLRL